MIVYPAIDIRSGKCVRLTQGDYQQQQIYSDSPTDIALKFAAAGAQFIHTVDLDGAKEGKPQNLHSIKSIINAISTPVQLGGGIRNMNSVDEAIDLGVQRVILGSAAVSHRKFVEAAVKKYGERIAVGIDARDGMVAIEGWTKASSFYAVEFAKMMEDIGVQNIIYTDIARDGMLRGPNLAAMKEMAETMKIGVIASGGVTVVEDVKRLRTTGVSGVIIGKALYVGNVKVEDALNAALE